MKLLFLLLFTINAYAINIAIDIGHSKKRGGAYSATGEPEFKYNTVFVKDLIRELDKTNIKYEVIDSNLSLRNRVKYVNSKKFDLFISIHHDSVKEKYLSYRTVNKRKMHYSNVFSGYSIFVSSKNKSYKKSIDFGTKIGSYLQEEGLIYTKHHNEPIKGENRPFVNEKVGLYNFKDLIVLKGVKIPAVLLEVGIIVNDKEEKLLKQWWYRKLFIDSIIKSIKSY